MWSFLFALTLCEVESGGLRDSLYNFLDRGKIGGQMLEITLK